MRPPLPLVSLLLVIGLAGCVGEQTVTPPFSDQGVSSPQSALPPDSTSAETTAADASDSDEAALSTIDSDLQDLEALITELESEETLDVSELLEVQ